MIGLVLRTAEEAVALDQGVIDGDLVWWQLEKGKELVETRNTR